MCELVHFDFRLIFNEGRTVEKIFLKKFSQLTDKWKVYRPFVGGAVIKLVRLMHIFTNQTIANITVVRILNHPIHVARQGENTTGYPYLSSWRKHRLYNFGELTYLDVKRTLIETRHFFPTFPTSSKYSI